MLSIEREDRVTVVRMERGKVNALDLELCEELAERLQELGQEGADAVVLTGRGSVFSAGVNLLRILDGGAPYVERYLVVFHHVCRTLFGFPRPLVAAINGHAIAGGCVVACCADRRIMAEGAGRIGIPELTVGVPFPAGPLEILRFAVPARHFQQLLYGGATVETDQAVECGLVEEVVEPGALMERALKAARDLAAMGEENFRLTKHQIRAPVLERMERGYQETRETIQRIWSSDATLAAIRSYVASTFKPPAAGG
jgi:enoyl-CoA hydratase